MAVGAGKKTKPIKREEDAVQRMLVNNLPFMLPKPHFLFAVPNGGLRSRAEAAIMKGLGVRAGVHDLILLWDRRAFLMEVKAPAGRLSEAQVITHEHIERTGCPGAVVRGLSDAIAFLRECGIPLNLKEGVRA